MSARKILLLLEFTIDNRHKETKEEEEILCYCLKCLSENFLREERSKFTATIKLIPLELEKLKQENFLRV